MISLYIIFMYPHPTGRNRFPILLKIGINNPFKIWFWSPRRKRPFTTVLIIWPPAVFDRVVLFQTQLAATYLEKTKLKIYATQPGLLKSISLVSCTSRPLYVEKMYSKYQNGENIVQTNTKSKYFVFNY